MLYEVITNAKNKAAVFVVIVGIRNVSIKKKFVFSGEQKSTVDNINPYLTSAKSSYILRRSKPLNPELNKIVYGNLLNDGGHLTFTEDEKNSYNFV